MDAPTPADGDRLAAGVREARAAAAYAADTPEGGMSLGDLETAVGDLVAAERAYRAVVANAPGFVPAHVNLADVLRRRGLEGEATAVLEAARRAAPEAAALHHALALAYVRARRLGDAGTHLERAATLAPEAPGFAVAGGHLADTGGPDRTRPSTAGGRPPPVRRGRPRHLGGARGAGRRPSVHAEGALPPRGAAAVGRRVAPRTRGRRAGGPPMSREPPSITDDAAMPPGFV
jgi:tetratricopeptide (TPR) repeat protein